MKVAIITMRPKLADKKANLEIIKKHIEKTKADMYIFGELTICGYHVKDELRDIAETVDGPTIKYVKELAKKQKCYIVSSPKIYISALFFSMCFVIISRFAFLSATFGLIVIIATFIATT